MIKRVFLTTLATVLVFSGCSGLQTVRERELRIRYVNLGLIVDYITRSDAESSRIALQKEQAVSRIQKLEIELMRTVQDRKRNAVIEELNRNRKELQTIRQKEEIYRQGIYREIHRAMSNVAKKMRLDFILSEGDKLVYANGDFDITEQVLREIVTLRKRNAPITR